MKYLITFIIILISNSVYAKDLILKSGEFEITLPGYEITQNRWWSSNFFGNVHKKITKKAFELIDRNEYPDLFYFKDEIIKGSYDEDGHPNIKHNGGDVYSIWFSSKIVYEQNNEAFELNKDGLSIKRLIGVLKHYDEMDFEKAYENAGVVCHLTQDQATPTHAANIKHSFNDMFEQFYNEDFNIDISGFNEQIPDNLKPWEYYQWVQDDTRKHIKNWIDPETKKLYWVESKDAPPLGKDSTYGPYGSYGGGRDHFSKMVCEDSYESSQDCHMIPKSPEIRKRQISVAVYATALTLKNVSKNLPPLLYDMKIDGEKISFKLADNRCSNISYKIYKNDEIISQSNINLDTQKFPFSREIILDLKSKGNFNIIITDCDGNITSDYFTVK